MDKWNLIAKCLSENASDAEQEELKSWLEESTDNQIEFERAKMVWGVALGETEETLQAEDLKNSSELWSDIEAQLSSKDEEKHVLLPRPLWHTGWVRVAAAILLVITGIWWFSTGSPEEQSVLASNDDLVKSWSVSYTAQDSIEVVVLPDHSIVWLKEGSELDYTQDLANNRRNIKLTGEAFFDVKRDTEAPFVITTGEVITTVLGTQFQVKTYPSGNVEVHVESGSVRVDALSSVAKTSVVLKPGDKIYYSAALSRMDTMESLLADQLVNPNHWRHAKAPSASAERLRPERFVHVNTEWKLNAIRMTVVEGEIINKAKNTTYKGIVLRVKQVSDKSGRQVYKDIIVEGEVAPGETLEFKKTMLIDWFRDPSDVDVSIEKISFVE